MKKLTILLFLACFCCGCWHNNDTGICLGGYQFVHEKSYLKIGNIATELALQEELNDISYEERKFHMDFLEPEFTIGIYGRIKF